MKLMLLLIAVLFVYQENHPPQVKIMSPADGSPYKWGSSQRYSISVSDKEDGDTKFDEITPTEILLEARTVNDTAQSASFRRSRSVLHAMMASNCLQCHAFKTKLIGPSFFDISKKRTDLKELVLHVKAGSKGVWGDIVMPSHPELTNEEIAQMVQWILNYGKESNVEYYTGAEGTFRIVKPATDNQKKLLTLTASYLDHNKSTGEHQVTLKITD